MPSLRIGSRRFDAVVASVEDEDDPLRRAGMAGSVGHGILRRSNFVLDAGAAKLYFFGADRSALARKRPTIGIQFRETDAALVVTHVMSNSPASRTPLEVGDRICRVNDTPVGAWNRKYPMNPRAGTGISVGLCDGRVIPIVAVDYMALPGASPAPPAVDPEPLGIGEATAALAVCQGSGSEVGAGGCSAVVANSRILPFYRMHARLIRAQIYDRLKRHTDALADIDALIAANGKTAPLLALRAQSDTKLGKYPEAARELDEALAIDPAFVQSYLFRALLEIRLGRFDKSIEASSKALELAPGDYRGRNILALGLLHSGQIEEALSEVERAISQAETYPDSYATRGQIYEKQGQIALARADSGMRWTSILPTRTPRAAFKGQRQLPKLPPRRSSSRRR